MAPTAYDQKVNVMLSTSTLPDFMEVDAEQFKSLVDDNRLEDMTDVIDKFASPFFKEKLYEDGGIQMKSATVNGRVMAIPHLSSPLNSSPIIWIRKDWLDKLKLDPPKTMADVIAIATAFKDKDPDGDNKADTIGLAMSKDLFEGNAGMLQGFFNGYHAYPEIWTKDKNGKLVYGSIQPEMKVALKSLQDMFKAGLIDPEFGVKDQNKMNEYISQGKAGMVFGNAVNLFGLIAYTKADPNALWRPYPIVSADDQPALAQVSFSKGGLRYYVVRKGFKHPEAVVLLNNIYLSDIVDRAHVDPEYVKEEEAKRTNFPWFPVMPEPFRKNPDQWARVNHALETGDTSKLSPTDITQYDNFKKFEAGENPDQYVAYAIFGRWGSFKYVNDYEKSGHLQYNEFMGAATPSMAKYKASLDAMELTLFTNIILNHEKVDAFDKYVSDWKKLGGDKITKEVNDWYKAMNK